MRQASRTRGRSSCPSPGSWQACLLHLRLTRPSAEHAKRGVVWRSSFSSRWLSTFFLTSPVSWPGENHWQVGPAVVESPAVGAPQVGSLPDVVPEGTLLNMVLKRMHRPRCCSYQLVFEHRRPSCIQGLRWVSTLHLPSLDQSWKSPYCSAGGPGSLL